VSQEETTGKIMPTWRAEFFANTEDDLPSRCLTIEASDENEALNQAAALMSTCHNRLEKDGKIVLINHRMHQDDLSGRLLAQQAAGGDQWTVVELKAVSPSGVALWPEKFDETALARIKANITAQDWAALYQQESTAETGSYFKDEWMIHPAP
jgi:hypothetical protein